MKLLLQRFFHSFARIKVSLTTIGEALAVALQEAELLEEWNEKLTQALVEGGADRAEALAQQAEEFDAFLSQDVGGGPLRDGLKDVTAAVDVRRRVTAEIDSHRETQSG